MIKGFRRDEAITKNGVLTLRFAKYLESLGSAVNEFVGATPAETVVANTFKLQAQIGSGEPLTSDETGFTVDSNLLSVDMVEA